MSIRTILEINHDYINDLERNPEEFVRLLRSLKDSSVNAFLNKGETPYLCVGIRALGQRHHSYRMTIKVD